MSLLVYEVSLSTVLSIYLVNFLKNSSITAAVVSTMYRISSSVTLYDGAI